MNGDDKEEAPRPRPLSGGIWTLFSWLRRSERSSSSESLSSVGSARTAASFDFLAPGHCNFTKAPVVLTSPLSPPTETYKKRLQERNLRRQRDRDITLHRKYGLFREYGNGYDGFSLPATRRILGSSEDRQHRERRATSECLQRRAAYVPGKRRAPLPPTLVTASLPRSYKRKRPAPKPPIKNIVEEKIEIQINPARMSSNRRSDGLASEYELLMSKKIEKCDKKATTSKDTKLKTEKSFLKQIFENKKRNSAIDTASLRLLPSISELDKQAAEIVENHKLRQSRNYDVIGNREDFNTSYEGNSWFCTSCLRKYSSSVNSCDYCDRGRNHVSIEKYGIKNSSVRSSIYTQTNNVEGASSSQSSSDERKLLKEILKEMKDSLPKKHKGNSRASLVTETPTIRIGTTISETYKDLSSPSDNRHYNVTKVNTETAPSNRILSNSPLLSERQRNSNERASTSSAITSNVIQHKVTLAYGNHETKRDIQSQFRISSCSQEKAAVTNKDQSKEKEKNTDQSTHISENINVRTDRVKLDEIKIEGNKIQEGSALKLKEDKNIPSSRFQFLHNSENERDRPISSTAIDINKIKTNKTQDITSNNQSLVASTSVKANVSNTPVNIQPTLSATQNPINNNNNVTVVSVNKNVLEATKQIKVNVENHSAPSSTSKVVNISQSNNSQVNSANTDITTSSHLKTEENGTKPPEPTTTSAHISPLVVPSSSSVISKSDLHIPLKISTLLNPLYSPKLDPKIKENQSIQKAESQSEEQTKVKVIKKSDTSETNKKSGEKIQQITRTCSESTQLGNNIIISSQKKEARRLEPIFESETPKANSKDQNALPSTSATPNVTTGTNNNFDRLDEYDRRRHLIHQLEQSIAKGDEAAAADAAVKLAKLKLSCSVLSFSSQIVGESSTNSEEVTKQTVIQKDNKTQPNTEKQTTLIVGHSQAVLVNNVDKEHVQKNGVDNNVSKLNTKEPQKNNPSSSTQVDKKIISNTDTKLNTEKPNSNPSSSTQVHNKVLESKDTKLNPKEPLNNKPSSSTQVSTDDKIPIDVWIEDKQAARGPIRLRISRTASMADLRQQAEHSLGLATHMQRWIVGRTLCTDDATKVVSLAGSDFQAPFYLCVVQSDTSEKTESAIVKDDKNTENSEQTNQNNEFYTELMKLEQQSLVRNVEPFECGVCMEDCAAGAGVVLRECIHTFCRECLSDVVQHSQEPVVSCPAVGCSGFLQEREIRTIVSPEEYERWLARSLATAECGTRNTFHCRTRDCTGWAFCDPGVRRFPCPVCKHTNCVQCQAIHEGETCEEYQVKLREAVTAAETYKDDEGTQALLTSLISRGEALECPECRAIITKKWGCDWVKCSACKTEICWVTKGRRWGPGGRGDTSGGCRCGVDGQRCHPSCGYCH